MAFLGELTEDISELLFALASADRLTLLSEINVQKQRLITLSKVIKASAQECSRHLARLNNSGFIRRDSNGLYETTTLGKSVLSLLPSIQFLLRYKDYFLSHDLSFLPRSSVERIGELMGGEFVGHVNLVLDHIRRTISEAREQVWLISDQPVITSPSIGKAFSSRSVVVRLVSEQTLDLKGFSDAKAVLPERFEIATMREVRVAMAINEKVAGVCFPSLNGKIDFGAGFSGTDPEFRAWCRDLFDHYWTKSAKIVMP